jgi:uncharacterized lipoprotein YehR (DUF1307 family)
MRKVKYIATMLLASAMSISLIACGNSNDDTEQPLIVNVGDIEDENTDNNVTDNNTTNENEQSTESTEVSSETEEEEVDNLTGLYGQWTTTDGFSYYIFYSDKTFVAVVTDPDDYSNEYLSGTWDSDGTSSFTISYDDNSTTYKMQFAKYRRYDYEDYQEALVLKSGKEELDLSYHDTASIYINKQ